MPRSPVGTMTWSLSLCLIFAALNRVDTKTIGTSNPRSVISKVGPLNWLKRLSAEERAEINAHCSGSWPKSRVDADARERIVGGELSPPGMFPSAAVFQDTDDSDDRRPGCGATFISRRHLITAAHCLSDLRSASRLMAGGVCMRQLEPDCPRKDMVEVEYAFAIKEYHRWGDRAAPVYDRPPLYDVDLVQLSKPINSSLPAVNFACLPPPLTEVAPTLPEMVYVRGWGLDQIEYTRPSFLAHLRHARMLTQPRSEWSSEARELQDACNSVPHLFCLYSPREDVNVSAYNYDSGNGAIEILNNKIEVVHGVAHAMELVSYSHNASEQPKLRTFNIYQRVTYYLGDLCFYLNLCPPSGDSAALSARLKLGSIYTPMLRSQLPPIHPFRMIGCDMETAIIERCNKSADGSLPITWMAILHRSGNEGSTKDSAECMAHFLTASHLVTSRRCIIAWLRKIKQSSDTRRRLSFCAQPLQCIYTGSNDSVKCSGRQQGCRPAEFIAWYSDVWDEERDFTLVQLAPEGAIPVGEISSAGTAPQPFCLQRAPFNDGDQTEEWTSKNRTAKWGDYDADKSYRKKLNHTFALLPLAARSSAEFTLSRHDFYLNRTLLEQLPLEREMIVVNASGNIYQSSIDSQGLFAFGVPLINADSGRLVGMLVKVERQQLRFSPTYRYRALMCTYLGLRCTPQKSTFSYWDNRLPYFNRFVYSH